MTFLVVPSPLTPPLLESADRAAPVETTALRIMRITYSNGVIMMVAVAFSGSLFIHTPLRRPHPQPTLPQAFSGGLTCSDVCRESCLGAGELRLIRCSCADKYEL